MLPDGYICDLDLSDHHAELQTLAWNVWPEYLLGGGDIDEPGDELSLLGAIEPQSDVYFAWGVRYQGELVAAFTAVSLPAPTQGPLSEEGWRFAAAACRLPRPHNSLCLLSASILRSARGLGLARRLLEKGKELTRANGLAQMIAPVRPSEKEFSPQLSLSEYFAEEKDGLPHDSWLRTHALLGGEILNICPRSVIVRATFNRWKELSGIEIEKGQLLLPGALNELRVDASLQIASYIEPNIWVRYPF